MDLNHQPDDLKDITVTFAPSWIISVQNLLAVFTLLMLTIYKVFSRDFARCFYPLFLY